MSLDRIFFLQAIGGAQQQGQQLAGQGQAAIGGAVSQGQAAIGGAQQQGQQLIGQGQAALGGMQSKLFFLDLPIRGVNVNYYILKLIAQISFLGSCMT